MGRHEPQASSKQLSAACQSPGPKSLPCVTAKTTPQDRWQDKWLCTASAATNGTPSAIPDARERMTAKSADVPCQKERRQGHVLQSPSARCTTVLSHLALPRPLPVLVCRVLNQVLKCSSSTGSANSRFHCGRGAAEA